MPRVTDHTRTEKIGGDSISFCGPPSRAGNRYDNEQILNLKTKHDIRQYLARND